MNPSRQRRLPWYRVPELWLFIVLIAATVIGTFGMMAIATRQPDAAISVPDDVPRPSRIPPISPSTPAPDARPAAVSGEAPVPPRP